MTTTDGPWWISAAAIRDYLALTGQRAVDDGPIWDQARADLIAMAIATVASARQPVTMASGALRYRGPKPYRLLLAVMPSHVEGRLPQLVRVWPSHMAGHALIPALDGE